MSDEVRKVLVMGGAGYIGSVLCGMLVEQGYEVTAFDRLLFSAEPVEPLQQKSNFSLIQGDLRDTSAVSAAVNGQDAVVLLAALVGEPACDRDPVETVDVNYLGSNVVLDACRYHNVPRFMFASTDSCYGIQEGILYEDAPLMPISLYGRLKLAMENEIRLRPTDNGFCPTILRLATVYGLSPRMRFDLIINILTMHAVVNKKIKIFGGKQWRPLVDVKDVARGFMAAMQAPADKVRGEVFNIGHNDQNYQIGELGKLVTDVIPGVTTETIDQPPDLRDYHVNFDKAKQVMGFEAIHTVEQGVKDIKAAIESGAIKDVNDPRYRNA
jgi:nucleoside-diphosphate-sugar epimerase